MTTKKFLKKKNKIVFKATKLVLTPKDQIVKTQKVYLPSDLTNIINLDLNAYECPYCQLYLEDSCVDCPMAKAGNNCNEEGSTWESASVIWHKRAKLKHKKALTKLIKRYNKKVKR